MSSLVNYADQQQQAENAREAAAERERSQEKLWYETIGQHIQFAQRGTTRAAEWNKYKAYYNINGGRRMRYKSTRRRGKTNRRRGKTHRRRHRKH